jgi:hypothetical protein
MKASLCVLCAVAVFAAPAIGQQTRRADPTVVPGATAESKVAPRNSGVNEPSGTPRRAIREGRGDTSAASSKGRFQQDLAECRTREPEAVQPCLKETYAARAEGLYKD